MPPIDQDDVTDRPARQLGIVSVTGPVSVDGSSVDVTDRPARQVGVVSVTGPVATTATPVSAVVLYVHLSAIETTDGNAEFDTTQIAGLVIDITTTSVTPPQPAPTNGTVGYFFDRLGADGIWYTITSFGASSNGVGLTNSSGKLDVLTQRARLRWVLSNGATSVTFSASVVGR